MTPERDHWARVAMYKAAAELLEADGAGGYYPAPASLDVVEISGAAFADLLPWKAYRSVQGVDVCDAPETAKLPRADLIVLDQVLEHVLHPTYALSNLKHLLNPRGRLFVATPFLIRVHEAPLDLWRWTRAGLEKILDDVGYGDIRTGAWGNKACVVANLEGWWPWTEDADMSNDPLYPVTVWAVGTR